MKDRTEPSEMLAMIAAAAALGAAAMYVLDPDKGRRRRAIGRDKLRSAVGEARGFVGKAAHDAASRLRGARARAMARARREAAPDDLMLIERVRARMGRVVSHPHAIQIGANRGRVTLSGPIVASEVEPLLAAARSVRGVRAVEDQLVAHERPESVPSLQGGHRRIPDKGFGPLRENWTPALRFSAIVGGGLLAACGMRSRSLPGIVLAALGAGLAARGATNVPAERLIEVVRRRRIDDSAPAPQETTVESAQQPPAG